jgi:hypothetical protein
MTFRAALGGGAMLLVAGLAAQSAHARSSWHTYCNARFGQCADIPADFEANPPPANGDGLIFRDLYGLSATVSGHYNVDALSLDDERADLLKRKAPPLYQAEGRGWFVVSGREGETTYYIRMIVTPDVVATLWIEYPSKEKERYDPVISRMSQSFRLHPAEAP